MNQIILMATYCNKVTAWKVSKYGVFSGPHLDIFHAVSNTISVDQRHLRFLMTEIYKSIWQLNLEFMWSYFTHKDMPYNLRKGPILSCLT